MSLSEKPSIPSALAPCIYEWETRYQAMNHPSEPISPANYVSAVPNNNENDGDAVGLSVITRNLDMLDSVPMTPFYSKTVERSDDMAAADILMNIQQQAV